MDYMIELGRKVAVELCLKHGTTTAPRLTEELARQGHAESGKDPRWTGRVFVGHDFEKTGEYVAEGSHRRVVPVWRLKNAAAAAVRMAG